MPLKVKLIKNVSLLVFLPLVIGAGIYRFLRTTRPTLFDDGQALKLPLPSALLDSAPSLLWSFALTSALLLIWKPTTQLARLAIVGTTIAVSLLFEAWQAANIGTGTFDWYDCLFSIIGCLFSVLVLQKTILHENTN